MADADDSRVHQEATVLLAHVHMARKYTPVSIEYDRPDQDLPGRQVDIPKLRQGGVKCIWLSEGAPGEVTVDPEPKRLGGTQPNLRAGARCIFHGPAEVQRLLRGLDAMIRLCQQYPDDLELATSVAQARDIANRGRIAVFIHTEALMLANDLAMLRSYHGLGLRVSGLVHAVPQDWIDCDREQRDPGGLTDFGRQVIREMNTLGMLIDVSHASEQAIRDVLDESKDPIVASHANARALSPLMRNLTDETIRGIADGGGVIGIHCSSAFSDINCFYNRTAGSSDSLWGKQNLELIGQILTPGGVEPFSYESNVRSRPRFDAGAVYPTAKLDKLMDQVDYLVQVAGVDHVGIGTDLNGLEDPIEGFASVAETPNVTSALLQRGYSSEDIQKILGENFLRVLATVIDG